jgi:hypothetical protein
VHADISRHVGVLTRYFLRPSWPAAQPEHRPDPAVRTNQQGLVALSRYEDGCRHGAAGAGLGESAGLVIDAAEQHDRVGLLSKR